MIPHSKSDQITETRKVFRLLVLYRWLSLIPAVLPTIEAASPERTRAVSALLAAAVANLLITLFAAQLNTALQRRPWLMTLDLLLCTVFAALTGGWNTAFYLYCFSPLLAAAFFFEMRGALLGATGMALLFFTAGLLPFVPDQILRLVAELVGFFLIAGAFGYANRLLAQLRASHAELDRTHRDLAVIHELTLSLQSAADVNEVEERVLEAVITDLGFPKAIIALVDQTEGVITAWLGRSRDGQALLAGALPHPTQIPLKIEAGPIPQALLDGQIHLSVRELRTHDASVNAALGTDTYHIFPMLLREHPVGVLLVGAAEGNESARLNSLRAITSQAAVAVGTTMLCIDRAQRLAVQDERIRIAREIHDTVSQSLFGLTYSLDACLKLLPTEPETVKTELGNVLKLAEATRTELRQSILDIWPSELTGERFANDLRRYITETCRVAELSFAINVRGDLMMVPPRARRSLYRIAQETLTNVARHALASQAEVALEISDAAAVLTVHDNGRGFEPKQALARAFNREHFGLRGIQERAASLGGTSEFRSQPGTGTTVRVTIPLASAAVP